MSEQQIEEMQDDEELEELPEVEQEELPEVQQIEPPKPFTLDLQTKQYKLLKKTVKICDEMGMSDLTFIYNGKALRLRQMESTKVALVDVNIVIKDDDLENFDETKLEESKFTVEKSPLLRALSLDTPTISLEGNTLTFTGGLGYTGKRASVEVPLTDPEEPCQLDDPEAPFDIEASLRVQDIVNGAKRLLGDRVEDLKFVNSQGALTVEARTYTQKATITKFSSKGPDGTATYSRYMLQALGSGEWDIAFSKDNPICLQKSETSSDWVEDRFVKTPVGTIKVIIAPRIEVD